MLAALGELADAGVVGFSDDGAPVRSAAILRSALAYAGALGLPIVDHPEDAVLTDGAEANDGFVATVLGLRGWPAAAEAMAVGRDLSVLVDVLRDVPGARLRGLLIALALEPGHAVPKARLVDWPHRIEPSVKMQIATRKTLRAPYRSAIHPLAGMNTARLSKYDVSATFIRTGS